MCDYTAPWLNRTLFLFPTECRQPIICLWPRILYSTVLNVLHSGQMDVSLCGIVFDTSLQYCTEVSTYRSSHWEKYYSTLEFKEFFCHGEMYIIKCLFTVLWFGTERHCWTLARSMDWPSAYWIVWPLATLMDSLFHLIPSIGLSPNQ